MSSSQTTRIAVTLLFALAACTDAPDVTSPRRGLLGGQPFRTVVEVSFSLRGTTYGTTGGKLTDGSPAYCHNSSWAYNSGWTTHPIQTGIQPSPPYNPIYGDTVRQYRSQRTCNQTASSGDPLAGGVVNMYVTPPGQNGHFIGQVIGDYSNEGQYTTVPEDFLVTFDAIPNSGCSFTRYFGAMQSFYNAYTQVSAATIAGDYIYAEFTCAISGGGGGGG